MVEVALRYNEGSRLYSAIWKMDAPPMAGDYLDLLEFDRVIDQNVIDEDSEEPEWDDISQDDKNRLTQYNFVVIARCWDYCNGMTIMIEKCDPLDRIKWWGR